MNATTTASNAERRKGTITPASRLTEKQIDRFAESIAALAAEPGAIDRLCQRIDALLADSRKRRP